MVDGKKVKMPDIETFHSKKKWSNKDNRLTSCGVTNQGSEDKYKMIHLFSFNQILKQIESKLSSKR